EAGEEEKIGEVVVPQLLAIRQPEHAAGQHAEREQAPEQSARAGGRGAAQCGEARRHGEGGHGRTSSAKPAQSGSARRPRKGLCTIQMRSAPAEWRRPRRSSIASGPPGKYSP